MNKAFIGDFGAGNMFFYSVVADAQISVPKALNDPNGEPSGYAIDVDGKWVLGLGLYNTSYAEAMDNWAFRLNIKALPNDNNEEEQIAYAKAWLNRLKEKYPGEFDGVQKTYWLIGCPTGRKWKNLKTRERYRKIFEKAGYENVIIVPESNAAMAYYQKTVGALDQTNVEAGVLLIDVGAYSTDATHYAGGQIRSLGCYLGASLIERLIVKMVLTRPENLLRVAKTDQFHPVYNPDRKLLQQIKSRYDSVGREGMNFRSYLQLKARSLKEDYFNQFCQGTLSPKRDICVEVPVSEDENDPPLILFINKRMMTDILENEPVREVLGDEFDTLQEEVKDCIGDSPWLNCFRQYLKRVEEELLSAGQGMHPINPVIILTGGGSMMYCIEQTVREQYPLASVNRDYNAVSAIGMGMAYWAPDKIRAEAFEKAYEALLKSNKTITDVNGHEYENDVLIHHIGVALGNSVLKMQDSFINGVYKAVCDSFLEWMNYECLMEHIPHGIKRRLEAWRRAQHQAFIMDLNGELKEQAQQINHEFSEILSSVGLEESELIHLSDISFPIICREILPQLFKNLVSNETEFFEYLWTQQSFRNCFSEFFENPSKKYLSDKRRRILLRNTDLVESFAQEIADNSGDFVKQIIYEYELSDILKTFIKSGNLPASCFGALDESSGLEVFATLYLREFCYYLDIRVEKQKQKFLGKLVLEEYQED